jgi:hypothetical protein
VRRSNSSQHHDVSSREHAFAVVQERHVALNWLIRFEGAEWDQVDTPT